MRILQAVSGYAAEGEEEGGEQEQGEAGGAMTAGGAPAVPAGRALEAALVSKSRHLEHKLTMLRLELAEAKGGCLALLRFARCMPASDRSGLNARWCI
jgi:hypothetical protein